MKKPQQFTDYIASQYSKQGVLPDAANKIAQKQAQKLTTPPKIKQAGNVPGVGKIAQGASQTVGQNPKQFATKTIQNAARGVGKKGKPFKNDPSSW